MSDPAALERRYRALLACYPADHRRTYGEEMIGVLLTSAPEGTTRPSIADTADLIGGGIRARLRRLRSADGGSGGAWRDALAALSILAPVLVLAQLASNYVSFLNSRSAVEPPNPQAAAFQHIIGAFSASTLLMMAAPAATLLALAIASAPGERTRIRTALLVLVPAVLFVIGLVSAMRTFIRVPEVTALLIGYAAIFVIELIALVGSTGPRRGWKILGRARLLTLAAISVLTAVVMLVPVTGVGYDDVTFDAVLVVAAIGLTLTIRRQLGLRLLLLMIVPLYPSLGVPVVQDASIWFHFGAHHFVAQFIYLPTLALALLACTVPWWSGRRTPRRPVG